MGRSQNDVRNRYIAIVRKRLEIFDPDNALNAVEIMRELAPHALPVGIPDMGVDPFPMPLNKSDIGVGPATPPARRIDIAVGPSTLPIEERTDIGVEPVPVEPIEPPEFSRALSPMDPFMKAIWDDR
jgi:hypothetical protein